MTPTSGVTSPPPTHSVRVPAVCSPSGHRAQEHGLPGLLSPPQRPGWPPRDDGPQCRGAGYRAADGAPTAEPGPASRGRAARAPASCVDLSTSSSSHRAEARVREGIGPGDRHPQHLNPRTGVLRPLPALGGGPHACAWARAPRFVVHRLVTSGPIYPAACRGPCAWASLGAFGLDVRFHFSGTCTWLWSCRGVGDSV